jgi:hypothetical protein
MSNMVPLGDLPGHISDLPKIGCPSGGKNTSQNRNVFKTKVWATLVKPPRPPGRGFCLWAAPRVRGARRSNIPFRVISSSFALRYAKLKTGCV